MVICDEIDNCPQTRKNKGFASANPLFKPSTRPGTRTLNQLIKRQISFILLSAFCENWLQNGCIFKINTSIRRKISEYFGVFRFL